MKHLVGSVLGVLVVLLSLWGGGWLLQAFPPGSGYNFAAFATVLITFVVGVGTIAYNVMRLE